MQGNNNNNNSSSLFGWGSMANAIPTVSKEESLPTFLFKSLRVGNLPLSVFYDGSGSTTFSNFILIYIEALKALQGELPSHEIGGWSSTTKMFNSTESEVFLDSLNGTTPFANLIDDMDRGTSPDTIIPFLKNTMGVIVTDGSISDQSVSAIQHKIPTSDTGPIALIIVPHPDDYPNLYETNSKVESNPIDSIKLSIPRAFAGRLAFVAIWNHKKKIFEIVNELSPPWLSHIRTIREGLEHNVPIVPNGEFLIKDPNSGFKSFSFDQLLRYLENKQDLDEKVIEFLSEMGVKGALRQQASVEQKNKWNDLLMSLFNRILRSKVKLDDKMPEGLSTIQQIKWNVSHQKKIKIEENKYRSELGSKFAKLLIDKTIGEITDVKMARFKQTDNNVKAFQTMDQKDKFGEISPVLPMGMCGICNEETHIFKVISIPTNLIQTLPTCKETRTAFGKQGKSRTFSVIDYDLLRTALKASKPHFHFMNLCDGCCMPVLQRAHLTSDPEYGVTGLVPQNIMGNDVSERLMILPLIDPSEITLDKYPNNPKLSFSRQWFRGWISSTMELDPASAETSNICLMFLTALANDRDQARLVYATQTSILRGGKIDKYPDTVGRLFKPSPKPLSSETLNWISMLQEVIELAEIEVEPGSNRLLLLCLIERQLKVLFHAKKFRTIGSNKLDHIISESIESKTLKGEYLKFGLGPEDLEALINAGSLENFKTVHPDSYQKYLAYYLGQTAKIDIQHVIEEETRLKNLMGATSLEQVANLLKLNLDYLVKCIQRSKYTPEEFLSLIPKFVMCLDSGEDYFSVIQKFL